jgi:cysteine-rich repeat protein
MITAALSVAILMATQTAPAGWQCDAASYADGVCDCGCDVPDVDCDSAEFTACARNGGCTGDNVPWEHQNDQCMTSTCGDGWKADGEACDDFNRLASGGCNIDCSAVNAGFTCGENASGCVAASEGEGEVGEGEGEGDGGSPDDSNGCAQTGAASMVVWLGALLWLLWMRRRDQRLGLTVQSRF